MAIISDSGDSGDNLMAMSSCVRNDIILANGSHVIHTGDEALANGDNVLA